jgi:diacylglycerol kinase
MNNKQINLPNLFAESKTLITLVITASLAAVFVILIEDTFGVAAAIFGSIALILAAHILNNAAKLRMDPFKKDINQSNQSVKPNNNFN